MQPQAAWFKVPLGGREEQISTIELPHNDRDKQGQFLQTQKEKEINRAEASLRPSIQSQERERKHSQDKNSLQEVRWMNEKSGHRLVFECLAPRWSAAGEG